MSPYDNAKQEIKDALLAGKSIQCGPFRCDLADCAEVTACSADFDGQFAKLMLGQITGEQFKDWALEQYAERYATEREDFLSASVAHEPAYAAMR